MFLSANALVVGAGLAGMTAALNLGLANYSVIVLTGEPGHDQSALVGSLKVQNWPGQIASGRTLLEDIEQQVKQNPNIIFIEQRVSKVKSYKPPQILTNHNVVIKTDIMIVATGSLPKLLDVPGEKKLIGQGIYTCVVCDGSLFQNKNVAVIGGGDSAIEAILYLLAIHANTIYWIRRQNKFRGQNKQGFEKIRKLTENTTSSIKVLQDTVVNINKQENLIRLDLESHNVVYVHGVFLAIGSIPNSRVFTDLTKQKDETIIVNEYQETNIPGVFAAGDVSDNIWKQAIIASAQGAIAGIRGIAYLEKIDSKPQKLLQSSGTFKGPTDIKTKKLESFVKPTKVPVSQWKSLNPSMLSTIKTPFVLSAAWCSKCHALESKTSNYDISKFEIDKYPEQAQFKDVLALPSVYDNGLITPVMSVQSLLNALKLAKKQRKNTVG